MSERTCAHTRHSTRHRANTLIATETTAATRPWRALDILAARSGHLDRLLLATLFYDLELDLLALHQRAEARRMDRRLMDEEVIAA